jgi:hypothetical protein
MSRVGYHQPKQAGLMSDENSGGVGGVVCRVGAHDWRVRRLPGQLLVHGTPLDYHVDEIDHTVDVADCGNAQDLFTKTVEAMEQVTLLELAPVCANDPDYRDDIEPIGGVGGSVPLLPNDPAGGD